MKDNIVQLLRWENIHLQVMVYFFVLLAISFGIDVLWEHPMCELCVLQRLWMLCLMLVAGWYYRFEKCAGSGVYITGSMLMLGLSAAVYQLVLYKVHMLGSACGLSFGPQYLPLIFYNFLLQYYRFAPCEAAVYSFMGLSFIWWNVLAYLLILLRFTHGFLYEKVQIS